MRAAHSSARSASSSAGTISLSRPSSSARDGRERLGGEEELHRRREGDLAREAHGGAAAGEQAPLGLHHAEGGPLGGDADVDAAEHLHAAGHAGPVDRRDDRLVELEVAQHGVGAVAQLAAVDLVDLAGRDLLLQLGDLRDVGLEVGAGHEVAVDAGDDRHPVVGVVAEAPPGVGEVAEVVEVEGVAGLGPVDGDAGDVPVDLLVVDRHGGCEARSPATANVTRSLDSAEGTPQP